MRTPEQRAAGHCPCCRNCEPDSMCETCKGVLREIEEAIRDDRKRIVALIEKAWASGKDKDWNWKEQILKEIRTGQL